MVIGIIFLILIMICIYAIKNYTKKLCYICYEAGDGKEKRIHVHDKNPSHYSYNVKIHVNGMTCIYCKQRIENALNSEKDVWAQVDLKNNSALVRMKNPLSEEKLCHIISQAGYTATEIEQIHH